MIKRSLLGWSIPLLLGAWGSAAQANDPFEPCWTTLQAAADHDELRKLDVEPTYRCFYRVASRTGDRERSVALLSRALERDPQSLWARFFLAHPPTALDRRLQLLEEAQKGFKAEGDGLAELRTRIKIVRELDRQGRLEEARQALGGARKVADRLPRIAAPFADVRVELAAAALDMSAGDMTPALRKLELVRAKVADDDSMLPPEKGSEVDGEGRPLHLQEDVYYQLGYLHFAMGRWDSAGELFAQAATKAGFLENLYAEAGSRYMSAGVGLMTSVGKPSENLVDGFRQSLDLARRAGRTEVVASSLLELGRLQGRSQAARAALNESLELSREQGYTPFEAVALGALSYLDLESDRKTAFSRIDEAVALALDAEGQWIGAYLWADWLPALWSRHPPGVAYRKSFEALDFIENLRRKNLDEGDSADLFAVWAGAYLWLSGRLLSVEPHHQSYVNWAFEVTERYRSRLLLERVRGLRASEPTVRTDPVRALDAEGLELRRRLLSLFPEDERAAEREELPLRDRLRDLESERSRRLSESLTDATPAARVAYEADFVGLDDLRAALAEDEALLSFQVAPERNVYGRFAGGSWLIVVSKEKVRAYKLPDQRELEGRVAFLTGLLEPGDSDPEEATLRSLYDTLLGLPLTELSASIKRLILVPDGALSSLPFGVLRTPSGESLESLYTLEMVPSATLWLGWRRQEPAQGQEVLVLADPTPPHEVSAPGGQNRVWAASTSLPLGRLPGARAEGLEIQRLTRTRALHLGEAASEALIKQADFDSFGVIHLAAHSVVETEQAPMGWAVLLAADDQEDGRLEDREITELELEGQLVVLSACHSAKGTALRGEGVMSLARSFFAAGARSVVASLWKLDDQAAKDLFVDFYGHLTDGHSVGRGLQLAKLAAAERHRNASDWAGVVLLGDGSFVPLSDSQPSTAGPTEPSPVEERAKKKAWPLVLTMTVLIYILALGFRAWNLRK